MPDDNQNSESPKSAKTTDAQQKILDESKKRWELCVEAEKTQREVALDDLNFRAGKQWTDALKANRIAQNKPCLTVNVLPARERFILNDQRQNRPAIQVNPVDDKSDPDTAEVIQGMIRHIEYDSHADVAYDTAFAAVVRTGGPGWIRLVTEFEDPMSFDQVIKIKRIRNQFQVYGDPSAQEVDGSDSTFAFQFETLTKDDFQSQYPNAELSDLDDWSSIGDSDPSWISEDGIRVCEYFYKEMSEQTIVKVRNPAGEERVVLQSKLPKKLPRGVRLIGEPRKTEIPVIRYCKHTATEVLEENVWPGQWIPLIPVLGDELDVDGQLILEGMVRHAKDPMRMSNAMASAEVEAIALAPKAPVVAAKGQTEAFPEWQTANIINHAVLRYDPIAVGGTLVGPPTRNVVEPAIQAIAMSRANFANDFRDVTGIYEAQYGARSGEKSGIAIHEKKVQGEISNFHYIDNLSRALRFLGVQIVDLIPKIYSTARVIRMIGEDGAQKVVKINQEFQQGGAPKLYDLTVGKYDVTISTGPSYQTKRQQAVDSMIELSKAAPQVMNVASDLIVKAMDWPGHEQIAERLRKTLPPGIADDDQSDPKIRAQIAEGKLQQMAPVMEQLTAQLNEAKTIINEKQVEAQSREKIAQLHEETVRYVAEVTTKAQNERERMKLASDLDARMHVSAHEAGMAAQQSEQDAATQQADQQHEAGMQSQDQAHQQDMQQSDQAHAADTQRTDIAAQQAAAESQPAQ